MAISSNKNTSTQVREAVLPRVEHQAISEPLRLTKMDPKVVHGLLGQPADDNINRAAHQGCSTLYTESVKQQ